MAVERTGTPGALSATLSRLHEAQQRTMEKIASGKQINRASDDAAGLAVLMALEAQTRGLSREIANRQDEISLIQTAEGAMGTSQDMVQRIRELSVQAANGTLTDQDRGMIQLEVDQLNQQLDQTANNTEFNTKKLLDGSLNIRLQNGNDLTLGNMGAESLGMTDVDLTTQSGAGSALGRADQALATLSGERGRLGAVENGIVSEAQGLQQQLLDTLAAESRLGDADIAKQLIALTTQKLQTEANLSVFRMDSDRRQTVLQLLS